MPDSEAEWGVRGVIKECVSLGAVLAGPGREARAVWCGPWARASEPRGRGAL